jgi:hypothetical protein
MNALRFLIVPTLRVVTPIWMLRARCPVAPLPRCPVDAERLTLHSHAERGNDHGVSRHPQSPRGIRRLD